MNTVQETTEEKINNSANVDAALEESSSPVINTDSKKEIIDNQGSIISLNYLKMGTTSSTMVVTQPESLELNENNLRVEIYRPISENKAVIELPKMELASPIAHQAIVEGTKVELLTPTLHVAVIEEPKVELLAPEMHVAVIEEPKIELLPPSTYVAVVEEPKMGILRTSDGDEIIIVSDDERCHRTNRDAYESADDVDVNNNLDDPPTLPAIDSCCCHSRRVRERETQTDKKRLVMRQRSCMGATPSTGIMVGVSSNYDSSEQLTQKLKISTQPQNTFKQRQLELHRHRIAVEQKRLELLELKLARERDEMLRERILFEKELDLKIARIRRFTEDRLDL